MTRPGRVQFTTREKAVTNDIVRLQDLMGQDLMEILRGISGRQGNPSAAGDDVPEDRSCVVQGMAAIPSSGMVLSIGTGYALIPDSAGPATADLSSNEVARIATAKLQTITAADPVNPRYDLIEIEATSETTETQSRDIYNPVTGLFSPASVPKIIRPSITGSTGIGTLWYTAGTPAVSPVIPAFAAASANRVPLAAVRVNALAVAIVANDILDLRPLFVPAPLNRAHGIVNGFELTTANPLTDVTNLVVRAGVAVVDGQLVRRPISSSQAIASIVEAGVGLAANTWYYVYLFACRDGSFFRPRMTQPSATQTEGIIVLSDKTPTPNGFPSSPVAFPTAGGPTFSMFGGDSSSRGCYLGAVKTGAVATNLRPFFRSSNWIRRNRHIELFSAPAAVGGTVLINLESAGDLPASCRAVEAFLKVVVTAAILEQSIIVRPSGALAGAHDIPFGFTPISGQTSIFNSPTFVMSFDSSFQQIDVVLTGTVFDTSPSIDQFVVIGMHDPTPRASA